MTANPHETKLPASSSPSGHASQLSTGGEAVRLNVPVFSCIVYVAADPAGGVRARVANLAGLEFTAATERAALAKIVPAFKERVSDLLQSNTPIPWLDPPAPAAAGEQLRLIPVHL